MSNKKQPFLYMQIANDLRNDIFEKKFKFGEIIPSEHELCEQYKASRISIRRALQILVDEGLIERRAGYGSTIVFQEATNESLRTTINIFATSPSNYIQFSMPLIVDRFEQKYPHFKVNVINIPSQHYWSYFEMMKEQLEPDILFLTDRLFNSTPNWSHFINLNQIVTNYKSLFYSKLLHSFSIKHDLKAIPVTFSPVILTFNPELFRAFGLNEPSREWSLEEMLHTMERLTYDNNGDGITDQYGMSISSAASRWPVLAMQNMKYLNELMLYPENLRSTLELIHKMLYIDRSAILFMSDYSKANNMPEPFIHGKVAMTLTSIIELAAWRHQGMSFEPGIAPIKLGPYNSTLLLANVMMIPKASQNKSAAQSFIEFAISTVTQEYIAETIHFLSVYKTINEQVWGKSSVDYMNISDIELKGGQFLHQIFDSMEQMQDLNRAVELFWTGLQSIDETVGKVREVFMKKPVY